MKSIITFLFTSLVAVFLTVNAQTPLTGTLSGSDTLKTGSGDYLVSGTYYIGSNDTLTVEPDVNVYFNENARIIVRGTLLATGAAFNAHVDHQQKGYWRNIQVGDNSNEGELMLDNCNVSNGARDQNGIVYVYNGTANLNNSTIELGYYSGIVLHSRGILNISNSTITGNNWPVEYTSTGRHNDMGGNNYTQNAHDGIYVRVYDQYADWQLDKILFQDATGVTPEVMPYVFYSTFNVRAGHTLTIEKGTIVKAPAWINVYGTLLAEGDDDEIIYFTSERNDNLGGDTNANGAGNVPAPGSWGGVWFRSTSTNSSMMYCDVSFGGSGYHGGIVVEGSSPDISYCNFNNNYYGTEFRAVATPTFTNNEFASSKVVPVAMSFDSDPVFTDNSFSSSDNEYDAIGLLDGTLAANSRLKKRNFTSIENVTYLMLGNLTIPIDYTLTIDPGIVIKTRANYIILVKGGLIADGTSASTPIVFTSVKDDVPGNPVDTNKDGSVSTPAKSNWSGIMFETTSKASCVLNHCEVKYASMSSRYYSGQYINSGAVTMENCSPTITNSKFQDAAYGLYIFQDCEPVVHNNTFSNTTYTPIALSVLSEPDFSGNQFVNCGWTALGIIDQYVGLNGAIPEREVAGYSNITYTLMIDMTIHSGSNVVVDPGVVIKFNSGKSIFIDGGFKAVGTVSEFSTDSITFTSINDDNFGVPADTRSDGDATAPKSGDWRRIQFRGTADDDFNDLTYCNFLFGGSNEGTLIFTDAGNEVSHSVISDSRTHGLRFEGTATAKCMTDVTIKNCENDPIAMSLTADPVFSETSPLFKSLGNGSNGIQIIEGNLSNDATLETRDVGGIYNVAYIVERLNIKPNTTLTIEPGVVIKFDTYSYQGITVEGALVAVGTEENKITFTSIHDDNKGGDTNDNGNDSEPDWGNWWDIRFLASDLSPNNKLVHCEILYGGSGYSGIQDYKNYGTIRLFNSYVQLENSRIEHSRTSAVGVFGSSNPDIANNHMHNVRYTPVTISMFSSPTFSGNTFSNIGIFAFGLARENYSTDATFPYRDLGGYENVPYYFYNTCGINSGTTITIPESMVFKSRGRNMLSISGGLLVEGTLENPVIFTHEYDDDYGNPSDTNADGLINMPSNSNGAALVFEDISNDDSCQVFGTLFRHQLYGIVLNQAAPKIDSCLFEYDRWGVLLNGVSEPLIHKNEFRNLTYTPLLLSLVSYPRSTVNNVISGSTWKGTGVISEELVQDVTLAKHPFADVDNMPYFFTGHYTVGTSVTLSIDPGVVCKFNQNSRMYVDRGLIALGGPEPENKIVFTDFRDDFYGGDMNTDSSATYPSNYKWDGIQFNDVSLDNLCHLDHCIIRYVGNSNDEAAITTVAASPLIENTSITKSRNGVRALQASNPEVENCDIFDIAEYGIENVNKAFEISALNCWWGSDTGPTHAANPGGMGSAVTDSVKYVPWETTGVRNPDLGDVSLNGLIQAYDASLILQHEVSLITLDPLPLSVADVDGNNLIQAYDASLVQQLVVGSIVEFPYEKSAKMLEHPVFESGEPVYADDNTLRLPLKLYSNGDIVALGMNLMYDATELQLLKVSNGKDAKNRLMAYNDINGLIKISMAGTSTFDSEADIVELQFNVLRKDLPFITRVDFESLIANTDDVTPYGISNSFTVEGSATGLGHAVLGSFSVYPNPTYNNGAFNISYTLEKQSEVLIEIYDVTGKYIQTLAKENQPAGSYNVKNNLVLTKGTYFVKFTTDGPATFKTITVR